MFYKGSLQEGISTAVGQQKMVFCFVTNDNEESRTWEDDFLQDSSLKELLLGQAVALRLEAGSDSAGYLAQIFPLPQTPTIVIMKHGELKEYIAPGTGKDEFIRRVQSAFNAPPRQASEQTAAATPQQAESSLPSSPEAERSESVSRVLAERAARLQAKKEEGERQAKEERAKAQEKAKADADAGRDTDAARTHRQAELVRRKKQQETDERRRILKRIEDDRAERRQRAAEREQRRVDSLQTGDVAASLVSAPETKMPSTTRVGDMASLQVRLFDGSTVRSRFRTAASFGEVRAWVDANRTDGAAPYTFRQLLTPRPNRAIDETEEEGKTLGELGLAPSSTLVLVPVHSYASAYEAAGPQTFLSAAVAAILAWFTWLMGLAGLGPGSRGRAAVATAPESSAREAGRADERRIRGFDNPTDARRDHQLYNGNSLNFEPRPDEDEA
ncbi:UBX domain-containing protein [Hirsutella rhossiliensis]|uniref:UBX domain-containing protein 2 n=1 Tax=Hirsutella rhossiliensis TaxID=111463 RepID=A0A9P8N084_9HYPO|nr:UBX domain-containing protein [Hirsutella rhossiliensis]KAH0964222.1 UBX domain-containing protein [Hirsutella rhossiliensis]